MQLIKWPMPMWLLFLFILLLKNAPSFSQNGQFVDKIAYSVLDEYMKRVEGDSVVHLTIQRSSIETVYTVSGADTQEAAAKKKVQRIFKYNNRYVLLVSNLVKGIPIPSTKQTEYRKWLSTYLKPASYAIAEYRNPIDSTQLLEESAERLYEPVTLVVRYRHGKFYSREVYRE